MIIRPETTDSGHFRSRLLVNLGSFRVFSTLLMLLWALLGLILVTAKTHAQPHTSLGQSIDSSSTLMIRGAADYPEFSPLLAAFERHYPDYQVTYIEHPTADLYRLIKISEPSNSADLVLSSAMDLQIRLVNDGHAVRYESKETSRLPSWANWRNEVFGYAYEPAVMVVNTRFFEQGRYPKSRTELLQMLRSPDSPLLGKVGLLDVTEVGLGYLMWAIDSQSSALYGRILESFGNASARVFPSSAKTLDALAKGEIHVAYNLAGSYSLSRASQDPNIQVVYPTDYTSVIMRSAIIPKSSRNREGAKVFLNFILSEQGQKVLSSQSNLFPIQSDAENNMTASALRVSEIGPIRPVPLALPLLIYGDEMKKNLLMEEWERSLKEYE